MNKVVTYTIISLSMALALAAWLFSFNSSYICNNTGSRMDTKNIFGFNYYSHIHDTELSNWVKSVSPSVKYDWVSHGGSGGLISCALGRDPPKYFCLKILYAHQNNPKASVLLKELLNGPREPTNEMINTIRKEFKDKESLPHDP